MLPTFQVQKTILDEDDPWSGILATKMFAMRSTVRTTLQSALMQLVFGQGSMLNIAHDNNWKLIKYRKQKLMKAGNQRENKS